MEYRITKDCGVGWNWMLNDKAPHSWGVSASQQRIAKNIAAGDFLLHFIDRARAWAGYSVVLDSMHDNTSNSEADREAHPKLIPIESKVWLTMDQSCSTTLIRGMSALHYHRKPTFTTVNLSDAKLIQAAIDTAKNHTDPAGKEFQDKWNIAPDDFYWHIARSVSGGRCWLCKETADSWIEKNFGEFKLTEAERNRIRQGFVDIAHIKDRAAGGPIAPDNVRALCPTCHRIVDRLPMQRKMEVLSDV